MAGRVPDLTPDVIVIGGGPAGSTAATAMAKKGLRVLLMERERFPREHIGESLLPASMPFLEWLGVLPAIEAAGYLRKWGATMVWGRSAEPWSWYFQETNRRYPHAYQVWRADFDALLLENSRAQGAEVWQACQVTRVLFDGPRATGVAFRREGGREETVAARFLVDASGQAALLGHRLGLRRWDDFFRNMAVYGYFRGARRLPAPDETNIFIESYADGWLWNIPLHTGVMSVGAVVDAARGQEGLRARGRRAFLAAQIASAHHTSHLLEDAELVTEPVVVKDWSYVSAEVVGDGYILAGDAACFVDPLFSSGVHLAMMSGAMAGAHVVTALKDASLAGPAALFYKDSYYQEYEHFRALAKLFYASNRSVESYFWEARRILGEEREASLTPRQAFIRAVAGRPPRGYERVVLASGDLPPPFGDELRLVEAESEARRLALAEEANLSRLLASRPRLTEGVRLQRQPEIRDGEFAWGYALGEPGSRLGRPCDPALAAVLARMDGATTLRGLLATIGQEGDAAATESLGRAVIQALRELYVAGLVTGLADKP